MGTHGCRRVSFVLALHPVLTNISLLVPGIQGNIPQLLQYTVPANNQDHVNVLSLRSDGFLESIRVVSASKGS